jgi:hypothetical protein
VVFAAETEAEAGVWAIEPTFGAGKPMRGPGFGAEVMVFERGSGGASDRVRAVIVGPTAGGAGTLYDSGSSREFRGWGDLNRDGSVDLVTSDTAIYGWAGKLVFVYWTVGPDGEWRPDASLLRQQFRSEEQLAPLIAAARASLRTETRPYRSASEQHGSEALLGLMLALIYTGESRRAYALVGEVGPAGLGGKEQFMADFRAALGRSRYADLLEAMGHPKIERSP